MRKATKTKKEKPKEKSKKKSPPREKKKRILFPWLKKKQGRTYKAMLAYLADQKGFGDIISGKLNINRFFDQICTQTDSIFPSMRKTVQEFYKEGGRVLTDREFRQIAICRLRMMFKFDKKEKELKILNEHPTHAPKLQKAIPLCRKLVRKKLTYDKYIATRKKK